MVIISTIVKISMQTLKRIARFIIVKFYPSLKPFLHFFRSTGEGVKVIIFYKNKLLLIRNTYRKGWTFPGGGVKKNECLEEAATREVYEEVGVRVTNLKNHGSFIFDSGKGGRVTLFSCEVKSSDFETDNLEVEEAVWVDIDEVSKLCLLPVATRCVRMLKQYRSG